MWKKSLALVALVVFAAGCGLETRTYVMTKERVGLDRGDGNGGCVVGECPAAPAPKSTTRKVYVWEITKPIPESEVKKIEESAVGVVSSSSSLSASKAETSTDDWNDSAANEPAQPYIPVIGETPGSSVSEESHAESTGDRVTSYTVQKDDTLQKISKKVFGSYGKWYKIYEANKDRIKNPNVLKPGTVLTIPAE